MSSRMLCAVILAALALSLIGCGAIDQILSRWDVTAIKIKGLESATAGQPQPLSVFVDLFAVDPNTPDDRRAPFQDPILYTWTVEPADGAAVTPAGVFTATQPGTYTVTASAFGLSDSTQIAVAPSFAGTYGGTLSATATGKGGKTAQYDVPVTIAVADDGTVTGTAHFDGKTKAGSVYFDATAQGTVAEDGDVTTSGTMALGPSKSKAKSGSFALTGTIAEGTLYGVVQLMDGTSSSVQMAQQ
jgi:hypothetical protein